MAPVDGSYVSRRYVLADGLTTLMDRRLSSDIMAASICDITDIADMMPYGHLLPVAFMAFIF